MLRKDLDAGDFTRYARILTQDIGERTLANPDHLDAAASFIESTMGFDNMGYAVQRQGFEAQGKPLVNLVADLPGKSKPDEIVLVFASYDQADAAGVSALMCVAHALAGTTHARTIKFAAVMEEGGGFDSLKDKGSESAGTWKSIIRIGPLPASTRQSAEHGSMQVFSIATAGQPAETLARLQEIQKFIEETADAP
jgi:hypothetical protein